MLEGLKELYELQQVDSALERVGKALKELDAGLAKVVSQVESARAAAAEQEARLRKLQADYQDSELQLKSLEKKRTDSRYRLYGGKVQNPKELEALGREVETLGEQIDALETRLLELIEVMEPEEARLGQAREKVREAEERLRQSHAQHERDQRLLTGQLEGLRQKRAQAAAQVPAGLMTQYDQVRRRVGPMGVARIEGSTCGACHMAVAAMVLREIRESPTLRLCEGCGRILYQPD